MKNLKYFPFERNKYFYGKLLSVDDFDTEQKYANDKRRLINRFALGTGVVCGLNVVVVDDSTISIEKGMALDFSGREIIIDNPVTKKLSMINGFESYSDGEQNNHYLYLCLEYAETEKEPIHSIANSKSKNSEGIEYNKIAENYSIFLTNQEPELENLTLSTFYEETKTIYWGNGIRIKQVMPLFTQSNESFELKIIVENLGNQAPFQFSYELDMTCITTPDNKKGQIHFDENLFEKSGRYVLSVPFQTTPVKGVEGKLSVVEESFSLIIGGKKMTAEAKGVSKTKIIDTDLSKAIVNHYYGTAFDEVVKNTYQQSIYLAKIDVIKAGATYVIDSIETMPFKQFLVNQPLMTIMNEWVSKSQSNHVKTNVYLKDRQLNLGQQIAASQIVTGNTVIDLGIGGITGQKFYSKEIVHGLGLGPVTIILGEAVEVSDNSDLLFGAPGLFDEKEDVIRGDLGAKVDVTKGTFIIGIKCLKPTSLRSVKVHWTAIRDGVEKTLDRAQHSMHIKPDMVNLTLRETYYFQGLVDGEVESKIKWQVREVNGGTIDQNGMYTAPNKVGVFEIFGESLDDPRLKASTFVIVRDK